MNNKEKFRKISNNRSAVIEFFIYTEWLINSIISTYYFGKTNWNFMLDVLHDDQCTFGLRRNILKKILESLNKIDNRKIDELNKMNRIRNKFAHCHTNFFIPGKGEVSIDPRNKRKVINFEKDYKDFEKYNRSVSIYLSTIFKEMGGII